MDRLGLRVRRFISMLRPVFKAFITGLAALRVTPEVMPFSYGFMVWFLMAERYCSFSFSAAYRN